MLTPVRDLWSMSNSIASVAGAITCAAVAAAVLFIAPAPTVWWGWLIGGAVTVAQIANSYHDAGFRLPTTVLIDSALLAGLAIAALVMKRHSRG